MRRDGYVYIYIYIYHIYIYLLNFQHFFTQFLPKSAIANVGRASELPKIIQASLRDKAAVKGVLQILDTSCQAKTVTEARDFDGKSSRNQGGAVMSRDPPKKGVEF